MHGVERSCPSRAGSSPGPLASRTPRKRRGREHEHDEQDMEKPELDALLARVGRGEVAALVVFGTWLSEADVERAANAVANAPPTLNQVVLSSCGMTDAGALLVAAAVRSNPSILGLQVSANRIGDAGAEALAQTLSSLQYLNVYGNAITDRGAVALARAWSSKDSRLKALHLDGNRVSEHGARELFAALRNNRCAEGLWLRGKERLPCAVLESLADALDKNFSLKSLDAEFLDADLDAVAHFALAVQRSTSIRSLTLAFPSDSALDERKGPSQTVNDALNFARRMRRGRLQLLAMCSFAHHDRPHGESDDSGAAGMSLDARGNGGHTAHRSGTRPVTGTGTARPAVKAKTAKPFTSSLATSRVTSVPGQVAPALSENRGHGDVQQSSERLCVSDVPKEPDHHHLVLDQRRRVPPVETFLARDGDFKIMRNVASMFLSFTQTQSSSGDE